MSLALLADEVRLTNKRPDMARPLNLQSPRLPGLRRIYRRDVALTGWGLLPVHPPGGPSLRRAYPSIYIDVVARSAVVATHCSLSRAETFHPSAQPEREGA